MAPAAVGGSSGYQRFLEALTDPLDEEHDSYLVWADYMFDPAEFTWRRPIPSSSLR